MSNVNMHMKGVITYQIYFKFFVHQNLKFQVNQKHTTKSQIVCQLSGKATFIISVVIS